MRFRRSIPMALAVAATLSCDPLTAPSPTRGVYVLESLGGQLLPVVTSESVVARQRLIADTLRLVDGGGGTRVLWSTIEALVEGVSTPSPVKADWTVRLVRRDGALRAAEDVVCLQGVAAEPCESLWDQGVEIRDDRLRIGLRWYRRVAAF